MTVLLATTLNGKALPSQLIYAGKSSRCHPTGVTFLDDWNVTHSVNHWSNAQTMLKFLDPVLIPYVYKLLRHFCHFHRKFRYCFLWCVYSTWVFRLLEQVRRCQYQGLLYSNWMYRTIAALRRASRFMSHLNRSWREPFSNWYAEWQSFHSSQRL